MALTVLKYLNCLHALCVSHGGQLRQKYYNQPHLVQYLCLTSLTLPPTPPLNCPGPLGRNASEFENLVYR